MSPMRVLAPVRVRTGMRPGDLAAMAALTDRTPFPLSPRHLARLILADPALADGAVLLAEEARPPGGAVPGEHGAAVLGYAHVAVAEGQAWLVTGAVAPAARRRGIGSRLLGTALAHAREHGAPALRISGYPAGYVTPGPDVQADPGCAAFLRARGATAGPEALAMERELGPGSAPVPVIDPPGVRIAPCAPEELPDVLRVVERELAADWARTLHAHVAADREVRQILLARDETSGELLGVAAHGVVDADPERFGPIGVREAARGRGVGAALLAHCLRRMAAGGAQRAVLLWTGPGSPAEHMYARAGFRALRRSTPFTVPTGPLPAIRAPD